VYRFHSKVLRGFATGLHVLLKLLLVITRELLYSELLGPQLLLRAFPLGDDSSLLLSMGISDGSLYASRVCMSFGRFILLWLEGYCLGIKGPGLR
jgi:hypothetical protein